MILSSFSKLDEATLLASGIAVPLATLALYLISELVIRRTLQAGSPFYTRCHNSNFLRYCCQQSKV